MVLDVNTEADGEKDSRREVPGRSVWIDGGG